MHYCVLFHLQLWLARQSDTHFITHQTIKAFKQQQGKKRLEDNKVLHKRMYRVCTDLTAGEQLITFELYVTVDFSSRFLILWYSSSVVILWLHGHHFHIYLGSRGTSLLLSQLAEWKAGGSSNMQTWLCAPWDLWALWWTKTPVLISRLLAWGEESVATQHSGRSPWYCE